MSASGSGHDGRAGGGGRREGGALRLWELVGDDPALGFSPYCWRARLALAHKGLEVRTVPWRFTEKARLGFTGQGLVPVLEADGAVVHDSWAIARYLEAHYPERSALFPDGGEAPLTSFVRHWVERTVHPAVLRLVLLDIVAVLGPEDRAYFRTSREGRFGKRLEEVALPPDLGLPALQEALTPVRVLLEGQPFLAGVGPGFVDHVLAGPFMWARVVSSLDLLEPTDPVAGWWERMLDAYGGMARRAPRA
jgi:glutathione S-transferase